VEQDMRSDRRLVEGLKACVPLPCEHQKDGQCHQNQQASTHMESGAGPGCWDQVLPLPLRADPSLQLPPCDDCATVAVKPLEMRISATVTRCKGVKRRTSPKHSSLGIIVSSSMTPLISL
jgi:hypothetical protein